MVVAAHGRWQNMQGNDFRFFAGGGALLSGMADRPAVHKCWSVASTGAAMYVQRLARLARRKNRGCELTGATP